MKAGDLVKYMSRTILIVDMDDTWAYGLEFGQNQVGKYRISFLEEFSKCNNANERTAPARRSVY